MKKGLYAPILMALALIILPMKVSAGGVNDAENRILSLFDNEYEYVDTADKTKNGYYMISEDYKAAVIAKLSEDGVNMTDSEVTGYINQFYANIAVGVAGGYMYKVRDLDYDPNPPKPSIPTPTEPEVPETTVPPSQEKPSGGNNSDKDSSKQEESQEASEELTESSTKAEEEVQESIPESSEEEKKETIEESQETVSVEKLESEDGNSVVEQSEKHKDYSKAEPLSKKINFGLIIGVVIIVMLLICGVVVLKHRSNSGYHNKRRK